MLRSQDQAEVAELVPEVSRCNGLSIGALEQRLVQERPQQVEVTGLRLVEASEQPIDNPQRRSGLQPESGPSLYGTDLAVTSGGRFQRPHHGGADGNHSRRAVD